MSVFHDQAQFMRATEQQKDAPLYLDLVREEYHELLAAWGKRDFGAKPLAERQAEIADAIMDSIYVLAGLANCLYGPEMSLRMFKEVHHSNMSKVQAVEGLDGVEYIVKRRDDGKILKPETFWAPDLVAIIRGQK